MSPSLRSSDPEPLRPLTSLRFVAALLVVLYHCEPTSAIGNDYALGHAGVGFFFLLSGFILTYSYHHVFVGPLVWDRLRAFYMARIARIYPLHLIGMGLSIAVLWRFGGTFWDGSDDITRGVAFVAQASLIQGWIPNENIYFGLNSPAWSISVEAFFYALFPLLVRSLLRTFAASSPRIFFVAAAIPWLMMVVSALVPHRILVWTAYVPPPVRLVDFIVGIFIGIAFLRRAKRESSNRPGTSLEVTAIAGVVLAIAVSPQIPEALRYALYLMPFWAFLIWVFASGQGAISKFLSHRLMVRLGEVSFALYVVHWTVIQAVTHTVGWRNAIHSMVVTFASALGLSLLFHNLIEQPLRQMVRNAFVSPRTLARAR